MRIHLEPQLRGPSGPGGSDPSGLAGRRGGDRDRGPFRVAVGSSLMDPVRRVAGRALPLARADVDTDQIIPSHWLKRLERNGYCPGVFQAWRQDPAVVLNEPRYEGAAILLAGAYLCSGVAPVHA